MHPKLAHAFVAMVRERVSQGDCPTTKSLSVDNLEDLVVALVSAAERVTDFDWSDNDEDAVEAVEALRNIIRG